MFNHGKFTRNQDACDFIFTTNIQLHNYLITDNCFKVCDKINLKLFSENIGNNVKNACPHGIEYHMRSFQV